MSIASWLLVSGLPLLAVSVEVVLTLLTLGGLGYLLLALWSTRAFVHRWRRGGRDGRQEVVLGDVTLLKPVKGVDARMYAGFRSHCLQEYAGRFEIVFGVSSMDDPAVGEIERLRAEFPGVEIRLVECRERLGASGKVSNLVQMLREARYEHVVINDSDIFVSPKYLERVMGGFWSERVGMVTAPYLGRTGGNGAGNNSVVTLWSRLEALGISTDFMPGVLTARLLEGGIRFGLGSTLATTKTALAAIGGLEPLADYLADDYELGRRISAAGYTVELCPEIVETTVPAYGFKGYWDHQLRWARSTRDSRKMGYVGLGVTYCVPWALLTVLASGGALWSFTLLSMAMLARVSVALVVGVGLLRDDAVLRDLWLLPVRDVIGLVVWGWSFAGDTVVWRGVRFRLKEGRITRTGKREEGRGSR
jgi:ceramide glucosyltransferase